jgi:hypothetical protein
MTLMSDTETPLFQTRDEQRRISLDLTRRLLATIDQWGKIQGQKSAMQMSSVTVDALLNSVTAICVFREMSSTGVSPKDVQSFFRRIYKDGPVETDEPAMLLSLRARKDVLLRNLETSVRAF